MKIVHPEEIERLPGRTVVCLGFFDGVHIGHARLIRAGVDIARAGGDMACVHTFDVMPARVLRPGEDIPELTPPPRKAELMAALGVDILAISDFARARVMRADAFFQEILVEKLRARAIVSGFHHRFGYRGEGDVALLRTLCDAAGIGLTIIKPVRTPQGELVSSTAIREALAAGDRARAEAMLGREIMGELDL